MSTSTGNLVCTGTDNFLSTGILLSTGTDILLSTDSGTTLLDAGSGTNENVYFWTNWHIFGPILSKPEISQKIQLGHF